MYQSLHMVIATPMMENSSRRDYYVGMKPRHAAALALMGWYLMLPPTIGRDQALVYEPLSEWKLVDRFKSERGCRQMLAKLIDRLPDTAIDTARCVPSNDPHLVPEQLVPKVVG